MKISASLLDASDRISSVDKLNQTGISYLHIDVMDGKMVDNIQFQDMDEIKSINNLSHFKLQIHLMVEDVSSYLDRFIGLNIESITFHLETKQDILENIQRIHDMGYRCGIAICPDTDIQDIYPYLDKIDMILLMSVIPGRGGQSFILDTKDKIIMLKNYIGKNHLSVLIEVDGGINDKTISLVKDADVAVVGSYIVKSDHYIERVNSLLD
ncbi:MAG: ribulose-phosphate 3-epimerase [Bacilli bacterium]|nr:ribulose-phosphate 3-epimerase [Bacilli bacterium]